MQIYEEYFKQINEIKKGDLIIVHSSLVGIINFFKKKKISFSRNFFIDAIKEKIGKHGTLVFPTYNFDFCKKKKYASISKSITTGSLAKTAMCREDFSRTRHPIISFVISGKLKKKICEIDSPSAFGETSSLDFMLNKNAKNIFIDIDYTKSFTYLHHFEEISKVSYRFKKKFRSLYKYETEELKKKTYELFVQYKNSKVKSLPNQKLKTILKKRKIFYEKSINNTNIQIIVLNKAKKIILDQIKNNEYEHTILAKKFNEIFRIN